MRRILLALLCCLPLCAISAERKPNVILILLDDMGLHDAGFMGNDFVETPAMDQLAREGVLFTRAYANAPNCAPSRAAILSGQYAPRTGMYTMVTGDVGDAAQRKVQTPKNAMHLPEQVYTLAELLRDHGYVTAQIGKWNLGSGPLRGPTGQGFGLNVGGSRVGSLEKNGYWAPYGEDLPGLDNAPRGEYMTDRLNREAVRFVRQQKDQPFFLMLSHFAPHFPFQAPDEQVKKFEEKLRQQCQPPARLRYCGTYDRYPSYAAMLAVIDQGIAALRATLADNGMADNTVIVLMSDNGGYPLVPDPQALRGSKSQLYEGGLRVPMLWLVPAMPGGRSIDVPVSGVDIYPTIAALAGIDTSALLLDGVNLASLLQGDSLPARALFWYFPAYTQDSDSSELAAPPSTPDGFSQTPAAVIQRDGWKLLRYYDGRAPELYQLSTDAREQHNRYAVEKKRATAMMNELETWLRDSGGALTLPVNPAYVPPK